MSNRTQVILTVLIALAAWTAFLVGIHYMSRQIDPDDRKRGPEKWFQSHPECDDPCGQPSDENDSQFQVLPVNNIN